MASGSCRALPQGRRVPGGVGLRHRPPGPGAFAAAVGGRDRCGGRRRAGGRSRRDPTVLRRPDKDGHRTSFWEVLPVRVPSAGSGRTRHRVSLSRSSARSSYVRIWAGTHGTPPGAPVSVVRPVRLPYEVDVAAKAIADARGVPISTTVGPARPHSPFDTAFAREGIRILLTPPQAPRRERRRRKPGERAAAGARGPGRCRSGRDRNRRGSGAPPAACSCS